MPRTLFTSGALLIMADLSLWIWGGLRLRVTDVLREPITIGDFRDQIVRGDISTDRVVDLRGNL